MTEKRLARANSMTFKVLAVVLLQFQKDFGERKKVVEEEEKRAEAPGRGREFLAVHPSLLGSREKCGEFA